MMRPYRFVGVEAEIGNITLNRFGQLVKLEETFAAIAQRGGCALLSDEDFGSLGFTSEDMKVWSDPFMDPLEVPFNVDEAERKAEFMTRRAKAQAMYVEIRHELMSELQRPKPDNPQPAEE